MHRMVYMELHRDLEGVVRNVLQGLLAHGVQVMCGLLPLGVEALLNTNPPTQVSLNSSSSFLIRLYSIRSLLISMANVFIQVDKAFYFAGDTVQGSVHLHLFENINANQVVIKFKGWESARWIQERILTQEEANRIQHNMIWSNTYCVKMDSSDSEDAKGEEESMKYNYVSVNGRLKEIKRLCGGRIIARFNSVLYNFGGNYIPAGQYSFPFSFKTGEDYPASFRDKSDDRQRKGRIKYEMQAFVRGYNSQLRIVKCKTEVIIRETTVIKNEKQEMVAHIKSCCCIDKGISRIQCYFQKNAYSPGEEAKIYCILDNKESKTDITSVTVKLINKITYTSKENIQKNISIQLFSKVFSGLPMHQSGERQQVVSIVNNSHQGSLLEIRPTARGKKLQSVYFLTVEAIVAASCTCCSELPVVHQPILIYPYIPVNPFQAPVNWQPEQMPMINLNVNISPQNENLAQMANPYY